jgi:hypothetical protein
MDQLIYIKVHIRKIIDYQYRGIMHNGQYVIGGGHCAPAGAPCLVQPAFIPGGTAFVLAREGERAFGQDIPEAKAFGV